MWVLLFCGIALAGVGMVVGYGVWLAHKAADLASELAVLGDQAGQLAELVGQIRAPVELAGPATPAWSVPTRPGQSLRDVG